jgi:ketosteroid isomerase-like protein
MQEIEGCGNLAYELQTYSITYTLPGVPEFKDTGKLIWIRRKDPDGSWRIWREMWSSDLAPPSGAAPTEQD